jgi:hypothetical protein
MLVFTATAEAVPAPLAPSAALSERATDAADAGFARKQVLAVHNGNASTPHWTRMSTAAYRCPAGKRNANKEECKAAVQATAAEVVAFKIVDQGPDSSLPAGCSYNANAKTVVFNENAQGGRRKKRHRLVCSSDNSDRALQPAASSTPPAARGPEQLVWWLHIPKCGSTFRISAEQYTEDPEHARACCGYTHKRVPEGASEETLSHVAAMFREPKQRAASAFYYMIRKSSGRDGVTRCCERDWGWLREEFRPIRERIRGGAPFNETLANFNGCQTNMVLGHGCMERFDYQKRDAKVVEDAIRRMESFRFVGLESEWRLSICLFNFKMTGRRYVTLQQVVDAHATRKVRGKLTQQSFTEYDVSDYPDDPLDGPFYEAVETRFWRDVKANGISEDACPEEASSGGHSSLFGGGRRRRHSEPSGHSSLAMRRRTGAAGAPQGEQDELEGEDTWVDEEAVRRWNIRLVGRPS